MSMLQLNPHLPVYARKHGYGDAFLVIDYGHDVNLVYVVRFPGGETKHFYSDDVRLVGNPMNGDGWDIKIPEGWEPPPKPWHSPTDRVGPMRWRVGRQPGYLTMSAKSERKRRHKAKMRRRARRAAAIEHTVSRLFALMESLREPVEEIGRRMRWGVGYAAQ